MAELAVIFDKDGVITNNNDYHLLAWKVFNKKYNLELTDEDFKINVVGKTNHELLRDYFPAHYTDEQINELAEEKEAMFREIYLPDFKLTKGLNAFLEKLTAAGIPIGVATNAPQSNLDFTMLHGKIGHHFKVMITPKAVPRGKPFPDIYLKAAELLETAPERCVVFEDSFTGIRAARAAGTRSPAARCTRLS
ncbi:MAG: HAD family hydrolase, partial [Bacteroidota bacterium]